MVGIVIGLCLKGSALFNFKGLVTRRSDGIRANMSKGLCGGELKSGVMFVFGYVYVYMNLGRGGRNHWTVPEVSG